MKLLLDTCVLADFYLQREDFSQSVNSIAAAGIHGDVALWASAKSYTDIFYVGKKYFTYDVLQKAFLASLKFIHVCAIDQNDIEDASKLMWKDFEDCLINEAARKVDADFIITRDIRGFSQSQIKVATPNEIVDMLAKKGLFYGIV